MKSDEEVKEQRCSVAGKDGGYMCVCVAARSTLFDFVGSLRVLRYCQAKGDRGAVLSDRCVGGRDGGCVCGCVAADATL